MPPPHEPEFGLDDVGQFFEAFGRDLQSYPDSRMKAAGRIMEAMAAAVSGTGTAWEAIADNQTLPETVGSLAMAALLAGRVPNALALIESFVVFWIASPLTATLVLAGAVALAAFIGGAIGENIPAIIEAVIGLLRDILGDPIVLDLDGDGIELIALAGSAVQFDMDDDGVAERTGWVSPHDGLLVHDANANGLADGIGELFGSANVDGYDELATLDANHDGWINASDAAFAELMVWRDLDGDGEATADEMLTLAQAGIAANDNDLLRKTAA